MSCDTTDPTSKRNTWPVNVPIADGEVLKEMMTCRMRVIFVILMAGLIPFAHPYATGTSQKQSDTLGRPATLRILYPFEGAVFPADIRSPDIQWEDPVLVEGVWLLRFSFAHSTASIRISVKERHWVPSASIWDDIKKHSMENTATLDIFGFAPSEPRVQSRGRIHFVTSKDPVAAPIFFRAVPTVTVFPQEKDFVKVKWKLGWVSSYFPPETVMHNQSRCFNCHAASADGKTFGFEYNLTPRDKSGYLTFQNPGKAVVFRPENVFDWNGPGETRQSERARFSANLSAISPDGKVIVTNGKGLTFCADKCTDLLQYSFVTKGVILAYTLQDKVIRVLPGADNDRFIHVPTSWSPDGKYIYFFGAAVSSLSEKLNCDCLAGKETDDHRRMGWEEFDKAYPIKYDIYRIPYNGGNGGTATRLLGASLNGRSNYFPRASPDGKWIVFTQSANGLMLIRKDSDLYIIPASGGAARKLRSSGPRADSWHSWSPNSRWLAFASKSHGPLTDIVLTHIDQDGNDSPPIILTQMRDEGGLSANLPEFFNIREGQLRKITQTIYRADVPRRN